MIDQNQASGILGSALLFSGLFSPIFISPVKGQIDYFHYSTTEATVVLALAALALTLSLAHKFAIMPLIGTALCATFAVAFIKYQLFISGSAVRWMDKFADSPFQGINRLIQNSFALGWGWGLLVAGAVLVLASGRLKGYGK